MQSLRNIFRRVRIVFNKVDECVAVLCGFFFAEAVLAMRGRGLTYQHHDKLRCIALIGDDRIIHKLAAAAKLSRGNVFSDRVVWEFLCKNLKDPFPGGQQHV